MGRGGKVHLRYHGRPTTAQRLTHSQSNNEQRTLTMICGWSEEIESEVPDLTD
jgi:hypothetical protein